MPRLPIPGHDDDQWGTRLNEFLLVAHHADGSHRDTMAFINIRDFGAHGDATSDDSAALQAAITASTHGPLAQLPLYVPPGSYRLAATIIIPPEISLCFAPGAMLAPDHGTTIAIHGCVVAALHQIFTGAGQIVFWSARTPSLYPQWWGAYADATHPTETTRAIQAAMDAVFAPTLIRAGGVYMGASQEVLFPVGYYQVNDEIRISPYANVLSEAKAILEQVNPEKRILVCLNAYTNHIRGLRFLGGTTQIYLQNTNSDTTMLTIADCEFQLATQWAIAAVPTLPTTPGHEHLSALLTIERCKFVAVARVLRNFCDRAVLRNCWVTVAKAQTPPDTAIFENYGGLHLDEMLGVPNMNGGEDNRRWIDNYGSLWALACRFGGEDGGMPCIYHYESPYDPFAKSVIIKDSEIYTGAHARPTEAVIALITALPQVIVYQHNRGPVSGALIRIADDFDVPTYIATPPKVPGYGLTNVFTITVQGNCMLTQPLPDALLPYVDAHHCCPTTQ